MDPQETQLRSEILDRTRQLIRQRLAKPGAHDAAPYAGRVYDEEEVVAGVTAMLDFWLTLGPEGSAFERELSSLPGRAKQRAGE